MPLLNEFGKSAALVVFAVSQYNSRLTRCNHFEPAHEIGLPRVRTEPAERMNRRFHGDLLSKNLYVFLTIDKSSAQRALTLIPNDQHVRARLPKVGSQMMKNASAVAHARAGHDQTRAVHIIDGT